MNTKISKVAVLGSGIMGSGIACHFANIGVEVLLLDICPKELNEIEKKKKLSIESKEVKNRIVNEMFNKCIKLKFLEDNYHVTILAAAVVYYQVKEFKFSNISLDEICNQFNLKESNFIKIILNYYEKIKELK